MDNKTTYTEPEDYFPEEIRKKYGLGEYDESGKEAPSFRKMDTTEKRFEEDIETFFVSAEGGYTKTPDTYDPKLGLYPGTLLSFIKRSQPREWARFESMNAVDPEKKFCIAFNNACDMDGLSFPKGGSLKSEKCSHIIL